MPIRINIWDFWAENTANSFSRNFSKKKNPVFECSWQVQEWINWNSLIKNLGGRFIREAQNDFWSGKALSFYAQYNQLSWQFSNPGSFAIAQAYNEQFGTNYNGIYITKPQHYTSSKKYPVVVFAHGYLGSWKLYQGLFSSLKNCFVVSIATHNLSRYL